ncbi:MAG: molybdopterin-dependent oxidoreductase, partial [Gordonibacter sp.]|uniref:molybdopterin-dependent oxidoreductase n=1 Tax=Gordonibacter sp. TaxID=1968902 RepID=UPI002FC938DD
MNAVVENGWVDTEFITKHSVAPFLVKPDTHKFLRLSDLGRAEAKSDADKIVVMGKDGTVDIPENIPDPVIEGTFDVEGQSVITAYTLLLERRAEWPVERAAGITGISAADIVELTRTMCVDSPTTIYTVFGADHYYNGHWNYTCMTALAILTGNLGKPGAGFCGSASAGTLYQNLKEVSNVPCPIEKTQSLPAYSMAETILTGTHNGKPFDLRGLFVNFGDPVANIASRDKTIEAVKALDFLVVSDIMFSETAAYADILLPACYWFECEDMMSQLSSHPYLVYSAAALDPLGESKSDF